MYKRDRFIFVSNLKEVTCDPDDDLTLTRDAYLLSEHYSSKKMIELAAYARSRRNLIMSDNGNFSRMRKIAKKYQQQGGILREQAEHALTSTIQKQRRILIEAIALDCARMLDQQNKTEIVNQQMKIRPHLMIALEDFTIPVLMMSGLLDPIFSPTAEELSFYQSKTVQLYEAQKQGQFGDCNASPPTLLMVLHAFDFNSALQGAKAIKHKNIPGIAISYGASMRSNRWIEKITLDSSPYLFERKLPEKYIVSQSILLGTIKGMARKTRIHILGAGSPIVLVLSALAMPYAEAISVDSTAPFMDADDGVIYGSRQGFIKMKMYRLAARLLIAGEEYSSNQPFWKQFNDKYPSDWKGLAEALHITAYSNEKTVAKILHKEQALVRQYIPYFTRMRSGKDDFIQDLRKARSGSNFWVLQSICKRVRSRLDNPEAIHQWVEKEVSRYEKIAHPAWAAAVRASYDLTQHVLLTRHAIAS